MIVTTKKIGTISLIIFLLFSFAVLPLPYFITIFNLKYANSFLVETIALIIVGSFISMIVFFLINFKKANNSRNPELETENRTFCPVCRKKIRSKDVFCLYCGNKVI